MKSKKEIFLEKFISQFCTITVKRRTHNNTVVRVHEILNKVSMKYFNGAVEFTTNEIIESFYNCGFTIMNNNNEGFNWTMFRKGSPLMTNNEFINIKSQEVKDLKLTVHNNYEPNWKQETVERINKLKSDLGMFWKNNEQLLAT